MRTVARQSSWVKQTQRSSASDHAALTPEQMAAFERAVAFLRDAMARTGSAYLRISELHVAPDKAHGYVEISIRIDDSTNPA